MRRRSRSVLLAGSLLFLLVGIGITATSLVAIYSSRAAYDAALLLPLITEFDEETAQGKKVSSLTVKTDDYLGTLSIPRLQRIVPLFEGTNPEQLRKGAGHFSLSVLPGVKDNSVLAGHRDTAFSQFGKLQRGDILDVTTAYGEFIYIITSFRIVDGEDRTVIVPTEEATLTLSTCFPFQYVGRAPQRFIVTALLAHSQTNSPTGLSISQKPINDFYGRSSIGR